MGRSPVSQSTNGPEYFLPEWVNEVFYGGQWHEVKEGSLRQGVQTTRGTITIYVDGYSDQIIFLEEKITGYRIANREFRPVVVAEGE